MTSAFIQAFKLFALLTIMTGFFYPCLVTGIAQVLFPWQANGSLLRDKNKVIGSELIGQEFRTDNYFHGRISSTSPYPYNALASSGSNLGPSNEKLQEQAKSRKEQYYKNDRLEGDSPSILLSASGSGLDPHISPESASSQVERVAKSRGIEPETVLNLVKKHTQARQLGILGEPVVNILKLNLDLDKTASK